MKSFKFKYSLTVWILLVAVIVLSLAGLVWNVFNAFSFSSVGGFKLISYIIVCVLTALLLVFALSIAFYGRYIIKGNMIYSYFGFVVNKIKISDITEFTHFKKSNKLVAYFKDTSYTVIVISPELYDNFVLMVREQNKQIVFSTKIDGEDMPE